MTARNSSQTCRFTGLAVALAAVVSGMPLRAELLETDFESGFGPWVPPFFGTWQLQNQSGNHVAALTATGVDRPPIRRPQAYLFLPGYSWTDYAFPLSARTLEASTLSFRGIVLIFGYADDTHYYYAHISSRADSLHSVIMKVAGTQRATIHLQASPTPALNGNWQALRVEHSASGLIRVFVDNLVVPHLTANDTTYPAGAVAFGCFDDRGLFDNVSVSGTSIPVEPATVALNRHDEDEFKLTYSTRRGLTYQLLSGTGLPSLAPLGLPTAGSGSLEMRTFSLSEAPDRFFRIATMHPLLAQP